jgi:methylmalonyl-CoA mutase
LQEGVQGVCISSYQGGHMEYFRYLRQLLDESGAKDVKIFGGGGGVILHEEKEQLQKENIATIFHPDDGRRLGLEGMIRVIMEACDFPVQRVNTQVKSSVLDSRIPSVQLGRCLTLIENGEVFSELPSELRSFQSSGSQPLVMGMTGTGGAGKSSLI